MSQLEIDAVRDRYERRKTRVERNRYSPLNAEVWHGIQERQGAMLRLFARLGLASFEDARLLEVGCGAGGNLLEFLRLGFKPENLIGIELLEDCVARANMVLPAGIVRAGDASAADIAFASQDVVFQSTVFSSLLDDGFQQGLANKMWSWVKPGGGILWYDFIYKNPINRDVRGVPVSRVRELFPEGPMTVRHLTLAPPISRRVCRIHPSLYTVFNMFPFFRTHVLCWIRKS
jgi:SAM-dependent methyltransferase